MKITENFTYIGTSQNFERDSYATLAEMKAVVDKRMPDIFTATCKETGKFYIYNKNNEVDETLGKWRELSIDGDNYVTKTYVDTELAKKADTDHTHTTVNGHTVESDVPVDAKFTDTIYDDTDIKAELAKKADITSIPSKISELTNDSDYQTAEQISSTVTTEIAKVVADAPENFDTLKEMSDWIAGHENDASTMNSAISDNKTAIASLQSGKADKSEIPTTVAELTDSADYAKKTDLHSHDNKTVLDGITSTKISNWDSAKAHADSAHAPSTAQANVIEIVKVNGTALTPSNKAVNVTVPTTVTELTDSSSYAKKTDIPTTLPANGGNADTVNNHTVESNVPTDAVFTDTTYKSVTQTEDGLMSAADKVKLDGVEVGATKTLIDIELSSTSANPVQNKAVTDALNNKADKSKYGDTTINVGRKASTTVGAYSTAEGYQTTASENSSHAEGYQTTASGGTSHAEGLQAEASGESSHAECYRTTASGDNSHAEGQSTTASGIVSHAEGADTAASGFCSHAEGESTNANGDDSHAEGFFTEASGKYSHAEGKYTTASGESSHAEGGYTTASGLASHAEGSNYKSSVETLPDRTTTVSDVSYTISGSTAYGINSHAEGTQSFAYAYSSHAEGYRTTASESSSHAEGYQTKASGESSHAEGYRAIASGTYSHAEGSVTTASGTYCSHAEGSYTTASGSYSHTEGYETIASGDFGSHAEGNGTTASGGSSHAEGISTTASNKASHACGHYNAAMTDGGASNNTTGTAFVIGNGTKSTALSNAFSVQFDGTVKAKSTITASTTADYAEFFEWLDKNPNEEDRVGHFVTLDGDKIRIATSEDDYILGIVSGEPFVLGNGDCDTWNGMYLHDEFRRTMYEPAPKIIEILDNEGNPTGEYKEVEGEYEGTRPILNPDYDPTQEYISRFDRVEWSPIGMLGVLAVLHDGTAEVNGYVTVNNEGIATKCTRDIRNSYRVIKKVSDKVVEVIFR